ncbi:unnamed protein product [Closterium sp. NIES-54]
MGPPRISRLVAPVAPLVATDVTGATASCLLSWRRAGQLVLPRCSSALSPAQRYPPRPELPRPSSRYELPQPRAAAYGRVKPRTAARSHIWPRATARLPCPAPAACAPVKKGGEGVGFVRG